MMSIDVSRCFHHVVDTCVKVIHSLVIHNVAAYVSSSQCCWTNVSWYHNVADRCVKMICSLVNQNVATDVSLSQCCRQLCQDDSFTCYSQCCDRCVLITMLSTVVSRWFVHMRFTKLRHIRCVTIYHNVVEQKCHYLSQLCHSMCHDFTAFSTDASKNIIHLWFTMLRHMCLHHNVVEQNCHDKSQCCRTDVSRLFVHLLFTMLRQIVSYQNVVDSSFTCYS